MHRKKHIKLILSLTLACIFLWCSMELKNLLLGRSIVYQSNKAQTRKYVPGLYSLTFEKEPLFPYEYRTNKGKVLLNHGNASTLKRLHKPIVIGFYNHPAWLSKLTCTESMQMCPIKSCSCSVDSREINKADVLVIDVIDLVTYSPPPRPHGQVWVLFGQESPVHYHSGAYKSLGWRHAFNWTMTYRLDSDIPLPYSFLTRKKVSKPRNYTEIISKKTDSAVWFVSNCFTQSKRDLYVKALRRTYKVDIYGKCGMECPFDDCFEKLAEKYRFYLAFENSLCVDYITEKVFKIYSEGINMIPVVRGGADYASVLPRGTFINTDDFDNPRMLAWHLEYLESNSSAYLEILKKKNQYVSVQKTLQSGFCDLCKKMDNLGNKKSYSDIEQWVEGRACFQANDY